MGIYWSSDLPATRLKPIRTENERALLAAAKRVVADVKFYIRHVDDVDGLSDLKRLVVLAETEDA